MNKKQKFFLTSVFFLLGVFLFLGIYRFEEMGNKESEKIVIVTTLFPLYDFVKNIGGEYVAVSLLLPPGTEAHDFDPTPQDMSRIVSSDIFVYTGKFMEPWAEDIMQSIDRNDLVVIDASTDVVMQASVSSDSNEPMGSLDPHIWLDFENDTKIIHSLVKVLSMKDPLHKTIYEERGERYIEKINSLDNAYKNSLAQCATREIVYGGHYAFGYLAKRYHLDYVSAQGISPDAEPTANDMILLVEQVRKNNIPVIFYEELNSSKIAETLASETNTMLLPLNAGHNITKRDVEGNTSFIDIMEQNRKNLTMGLHCK